ncbi:permease [Candidatus Woesearchaeota archaeon]|nr:permease [Candidatus Woesearchaeota archaeon]
MKKERHIDPICGMEGVHKAHGKWFCSHHCLRKYEKQHNLGHAPCPSCTLKPTKWYKERLYLVSLITIVVLVVSYTVAFFNPVFDAFLDYLKLIWWAILLGLFLGGIIDKFVPREYIAKYLSAQKKTTVFNAVILGFLMSACSHGILAIAIELYKKGASIPAVITFLLASPWANFTITIMLIAFFGLKALFLVAAAIIVAIITGLIYQALDRKGMIEKSIPVKVKEFSMLKDAKKRWKAYKFNLKNDVSGVVSGTWSLAKMILWWIMIGMLLASIARAFVPVHIFHQYMGPTIIGLVITLIAATIIEVCSEGSSPLAFEIYKQTAAFGNSFVFLLAGVATDYTEIGLIWSNIGKKAAIWLPIITVPQILIIGYLFNIFI